MPELPEVEIASRQLRSWLKGRRIVEAQAPKSRVIRGQAPSRFAELKGHRLQSIERIGKWMLLDFDRGESLVSHLGMTGKWIRRKSKAEPPPHVRASIALNDGNVVDYRDPRLFGRLIRGTNAKLRELPTLRALGPDPLKGIDLDRLQQLFSRTKRSLKETLMDQRTLAGLGNIHVGEALHRAKLSPQRPSSTMTPDETKRLARAIEASLKFALKLEDSPEPITYVEEGGPNRFLVYDRAGDPCRSCGSRIERIVQGGRSTFFCPHCQSPWSNRASKRRPRRRK